MTSVTTKRIAGAVVMAGVAGVAGYVLVRPKLLHWGARQDEVDRVLPGDELVPNATYTSTRAVTIEATPADIWPWLAQMGYGRGGLYSYDWLDRAFGYLDAPSSNVVLPEFQELKAGDTIPAGRGPSWPVRIAEPDRALVLEPVAGRITWMFALVPISDAATRLITRVRCAPPASLQERVAMALVDPAAFVMTRGMLLGIKRRAEALAAARENEEDEEAVQEERAIELLSDEALATM